MTSYRILNYMDKYSIELSEQEKTSFNQQWNTYEGQQGGNNVKALLQKLIANCNTNKEEDSRLVDIEIGENGVSEVDGFNMGKWVPITVNGTREAPEKYEDLIDYRAEGEEAYSPDAAFKVIQMVRNGVEARHTYTISISYNPKTSLVDVITINY